MSIVTNYLKGYAKDVVKKYRQRQLSPGESGWGQPKPLPPSLPQVGSDKHVKIAIIGIGAQGIAQGQGIQAIKGAQIAGVADLNAERLDSAARILKLDKKILFQDAEQMLKSIGPVDLVSIATTAPFHVALGRVALKNGAKRIMLEKPIDNSLKESKKFRDECKAAGVELIVNYSRRWLIDINAIKRVLDKGFIGKVKSISCLVGKGELAMIGSHYFDFCNMVMSAFPVDVIAHLEPITQANRRGGDYIDPHGYCLFTYPQGQRAFVDFSSDFQEKNAQILVKGTNGYISIDEPNMTWNVQVNDQKLWTIPFAEQMKASVMFSRVVENVLGNKKADNCTAEDGIAALEMILGAHISSNNGGKKVRFPLTEQEAELNIVFP